MRQLILLRGAPGSGKSSWIEKNNLKQFTICPDDIRLMIQTPIQTLGGNFQISQKNDKDVWSLVFQIMEKRMSRGELTIIDATHSRTTLISKYKHLIDQYRYRTFIVDFTDIPIEEVKKRNKARSEYKQVPEDVIDLSYSRFETQKAPNWCKVIKPEDYYREMVWRKEDYSNYKKIVHIGDIHGCYEPLAKYFEENTFNNENLYIFIGDYVDRGIQNTEVLNFLLSIFDKSNVILFEGNHERWIWKWACNKLEDIKSKEFVYKTMPQIEGKVDKDECRRFYRKLQQIVLYEYPVGDEKYTILVNHAGISNLPSDLIYMSLDSFIHGVGTYNDDIDRYWFENTSKFARNKNLYQIRGHRNTLDLPIQSNEKSFCLEGKVEFGGELRIVELSNEGFKTIEIKNNIFDPQLKDKQELKKVLSGESTINQTNVLQVLRKNKLIIEKAMGDNISSFNFSRRAFQNREWNSVTVRARGLFVDISDGNIIARSYDKFFNHREIEETKSDTLNNNLKFPVMAYLKENGFLGLISYNPKNDDFFIASKSTNKGPYVEYIKKIFFSMSLDFDQIKVYLKENNVTLVLEVIDPINDPHIIEYSKPIIYLLDIIKNEYVLSKLPYGELYNFAMEYGFWPKLLFNEFKTWDEIYSFLHEFEGDYEYLWRGSSIEGLVFEDANVFMFKKKSSYYSFWKYMRGVKETYARGRVVNLASLHEARSNYFYGWLKTLDKEYVLSKNIIELRNEYEGMKVEISTK